jgi:hypothetical protein
MPDKGPPADSPPNLAEIERNSREYQQLASTVADRIKAFEEWFNHLPGKLEVYAWQDASNSEPVACLKVERYKDVWRLSFGTANGEDEGVSVRPLENASLADKCRAVSMLPDLLQNLYNEQRAAVDRLKTAANVFAQLANTKGGK